MTIRIGLVVALASGLSGGATLAQGPAGRAEAGSTPQAAQVDLATPFHTRSPWRLVVSEGAPTKDYGDNPAPGALTFCLRKGAAGPCMSSPVTLPLRTRRPDDPTGWEPHYLIAAKAVYPRGAKAEPLLLIVTGSLNSGDGDQIVATQLVAYNAGKDAFLRVFDARVGHNNNQEIRFVTAGPLQGSVIKAEPQEHPPYGFWMTIYSLAPSGVYRQVLRYRSATVYNDGNPLAVIDSEMPNIEKRLGLWKPGQRLPTPTDQLCLKPTLRRTELWCG